LIQNISSSITILILTCQKLNHQVGLQQGHWQLFHPKTESLPKKQRITATEMMLNNGKTKKNTDAFCAYKKLMNKK
jgi:hypothetical protein